MSWFALFGYLFVCIWQPLQIYKIWKRRSADDLSIYALGAMSLGMILIQLGFINDGALPVYLWGNGFAALCSLVLIGQYFYFNKK